jgi:hypothetical protein
VNKHFTHDAAFQAEAAKQPRHLERYARATMALMGQINDAIAQAEAPASPAEKVRNLENAKWGLARLREVDGVDGVKLTGIDEVGRRLELLEGRYRAFGFYKMAGVP